MAGRGGFVRWAALAIALASAVPGAAQQHRARIYGVDDGVPSAEIHDLASDRDGRLWLATRTGLASYDGRQWQSYGIDAGLRWSDQIALHFEQDGDAEILWTLSARLPFQVYRRAGHDFALFATAELPGIDPAASPEVTGFAVAGAGRRLAIATRYHGLWLGESAEAAMPAWRRLEVPGGALNGLAQLGDRLFAATDAGLAELQQGGLVPLPGQSGRPVLGVCAAGSTLWLVGQDWLATWSDGTFEPRAAGLDFGWPGPHPRAHLAADAAWRDQLGGLFVGHAERLFQFRPGEGLQTLRWSATPAGVEALQVGREGILWAASGAELVKLPSRRFTIFTVADGLLADDVTAVLERRDGSFVLGHRGGLTYWQGDRRRIQVLDLEAANRRTERVRDLAEDAEGKLWLAGDAAGLLRLGAPGEPIARFGPAQGLEGSVGGVALVDEELWAGTDRGLFRLEGQRFELVHPALRVRRLIPARDQMVWVAAAEGLSLFDGRTLAPRTCAGTPCDNVFAALADPSGMLWVGTGTGLLCAPLDAALEPCAAPKIAAPVFWLAERPGDDGGRELWIGADDGVYRWWQGELRHFSVRQGIAGRELNRAAGMVDRQGRLWIGTDRGLSRYDGRFEGPATTPTVQLLEVTAAGVPLPLDRPLRLAAGDNDLVFRFRVVSLIDEARTQIRYRLTGLDDEWRTLPSPLLQEARYYDVPFGSFVFELQAANAEGGWGEVRRSAELVVAKPFYRQPWFFALGLALLLGAAYAVQSYLGQRSYSRRLEREVAVRVRELRASDERYRQTFQGIDDGIVTTDAGGRVILLNPRAQDLTGWSADAAVGRPAEEVLRLASPGGAPVTVAEIAANRVAELEPREGEKLLVEISAAPVRADDEAAGMVYALRDIRQRRQLEEEAARAQRLEAIGLLAGGIAHDFNNLLTVLLGNISLLKEILKPEGGILRNLNDAENALGRARDLTQQLLTFARGGAPVRKAAAIGEVIRESSSFALRGSRVRCELDLADDLAMVDIDSGQISQVLHNLLINAGQAMPAGGVVRIVARNSEAPLGALEPGPHVRIDVADQGVGIAEELLPRIFDPYFSTKDSGRGLGLASAYSIVNRHDGKLTVRSKVGRGTTFSMFLPASNAAVPAEAPRPRARLVGSGRVLVMDDDLNVRRTAAALLRKLGFEVVEAGDGREALDLYSQALDQNDPYRALLMDLTVPGGMGGQAAIKRLRDLDPRVLAVVYSGYSNDPVLANYRDYGFAARLSKPFRLEDLADALDEAFAAGPP